MQTSICSANLTLHGLQTFICTKNHKISDDYGSHCRTEPTCGC
ncbi:MAG TPA: hypothetical protein DEF41_11460 [Desulfovibrio sp.]|uniref:Uncharacterized protein n=1 Tax=Nitratidesulfovibrio vulgaris (strain ATCC 29579 / DSM 644 / CCUG 34227 / NCIMB 8303 / VKM B-1760 / Hildenborough) TaxID=882 RepID=Q72A63_NITV2|nr:hypothetical protein DVU_2134 [Nitratidesulfovibrio vulgaris str. Hildenborough]HBW16716.1 hypothetical protein [Desulfovibrio sp.]